MAGPFLVAPLPFSVVSASATSAGSTAYTNNDVPGLVWRSGTTTTIVLDLGGQAYDTIALIGTNLRTTDMVAIQTGTGTGGTGSYASGNIAAYTGFKPPLSLTKTICRIPPRSERYVSITISATNHPDGYVELQRIVVGKAISFSGVETGARFGFNDQSVITQGPGYRSVDEYPSFATCKISTGWITDLSWRTEWYPALQYVGNRKSVLFVLEETQPDRWQTDSIFGPIVTKAEGEALHFDAYRLEMVIEAVSA